MYSLLTFTLKDKNTIKGEFLHEIIVFSIHFRDRKSGWVVMGNGASLRTTDGGESWKRDLETEHGVQGTDFDIFLLSVKFQNHTQAWGIDIRGVILMTHNQAQSWERLDLSMHGETENSQPQNWVDRIASELSHPPSTHITNAHFLADGHGWVVGVEQARQRAMYQSDFANADDAVAIAAGHIYNTTDSGKTWHHQLGEPVENFWDVQFLDEHHGWIAGDNGVLLATEDGGKSWQYLQSRTTQRIIDVHFLSLSPKWGWAMQRNGRLLYTTDGEDWSTDFQGTTSTNQSPNSQDPLQVSGNFTTNDVEFGKFSEGWAVGENGNIIHNPDGGPIWTLQRTSTGKNLVGINMKFAPLGWAVGLNGVTQRTVNGGEYWKFHETHAGYDLYAVSFITKRKGWAVGRAGIILSTTDGGFTWGSRLSGVPQNLYDILAISEQEIYAVGAEGTIIHSTDDGKTWEQEHTDVDNDLYAITRVKDGKTLWVVGQWGVMLRR